MIPPTRPSKRWVGSAVSPLSFRHGRGRVVIGDPPGVRPALPAVRVVDPAPFVIAEPDGRHSRPYGRAVAPERTSIVYDEHDSAEHPGACRAHSGRRAAKSSSPGCSSYGVRSTRISRSEHRRVPLLGGRDRVLGQVVPRHVLRVHPLHRGRPLGVGRRLLAGPAGRTAAPTRPTAPAGPRRARRRRTPGRSGRATPPAGPCADPPSPRRVTAAASCRPVGQAAEEQRVVRLGRLQQVEHVLRPASGRRPTRPTTARACRPSSAPCAALERVAEHVRGPGRGAVLVADQREQGRRQRG